MFEKISKYLLILLPAALVTGPFIPYLIVFFLGIFFLKEFFYKKLWEYFFHPFTYLSLIFYLYLIFTSILSSDPLQSFESSLFYFRYIFFVLAISMLIKNNKNLINYFCISLIITLVIVTADAYFQYFFEVNFLGMKKELNSRLSGLFGDEYILGSFLSRLMPLVFFYLATQKNLKGHMMWLAMFFLIVVDILIYLAAERNDFIYLLILSTAIIILTNRFKLIRLLAFSFSILIIISLNFIYPEVKQRMVDQTLKQIGFDSNSDKIYFFSIEHQAHYISAYKMFIDKPIIGHGPRKFRTLCNDEKYIQPLSYANGCSTHPHNTYMQLLAEIGIVGTVPIIMLFFFIVYVFIKQIIYLYFTNKKTNDYDLKKDANICLYIAIFISLWPLAPTGNFFFFFMSIIYFLPFGFLIKIPNK